MLSLFTASQSPEPELAMERSYGPVTRVMVAVKLQEAMMMMMVWTQRRGIRVVEFLLDQLLKENGVQKE